MSFNVPILMTRSSADALMLVATRLVVERATAMATRRINFRRVVNMIFLIPMVRASFDRRRVSTPGRSTIRQRHPEGMCIAIILQNYCLYCRYKLRYNLGMLAPFDLRLLQASFLCSPHHNWAAA